MPTAWFLVATAPVPRLEAVAATAIDSGSTGPYVYATAPLDRIGPGYLRWTALPSPAEDTGAGWLATRVTVTPGAFEVTISPMNEVPLYLVKDRFRHRILVCSDPFVAAAARHSWGMPVLAGSADLLCREGTTPFHGVVRMPPCSATAVTRAGRGWTVTMADRPDHLEAAYSPRVLDPGTAGDTFVRILSTAIAETADARQPVATLLSGGIDSGAVTALASLAGMPVTAFSAGTPWGNEHAAAGELTAHLGIDHVLVDLSVEDLLSAVPETLRLLGTAQRDKVDIALTATALLRSGRIGPEQILTGYGNDLLNLGLPVATDDPDLLVDLLADGIDETRHSGELTPLAATARGKRLIHPYWHPDVVRTALAIHPDCKLNGVREKAYFRSAMARLVPESVAWRPKVAVHHGGGLQAGLDRIFGGSDAKAEAYRACFWAVAEEVRGDPLASPDHPDAVRLLRAHALAVEAA